MHGRKMICRKTPIFCAEMEHLFPARDLQLLAQFGKMYSPHERRRLLIITYITELQQDVSGELDMFFLDVFQGDHHSSVVADVDENLLLYCSVADNGA
jgi:hypothetical protein